MKARSIYSERELNRSQPGNRFPPKAFSLPCIHEAKCCMERVENVGTLDANLRFLVIRLGSPSSESYHSAYPATEAQMEI